MAQGAPKFPELEAHQLDLLGAQPSCVALHIRKGECAGGLLPPPSAHRLVHAWQDACGDEAQPHKKCPPIEEYMLAVDRLAEMYGPRKHIYLATDSTAVIREAEKKWPQHSFVYQKMSRTKYDDSQGPIQGIDSDRSIDKSSTLEEMYKDMWAMSACDGGFVGRLLFVRIPSIRGEACSFPAS